MTWISYWFVEQDSRGAPKAKANLEPLSDTVCRDYERAYVVQALTSLLERGRKYACAYVDRLKEEALLLIHSTLLRQIIALTWFEVA